jgi:hypothetical protein
MLYITHIHNMFETLLQYLTLQGQQKSTFMSFRADAYLVRFWRFSFLRFLPFKNVNQRVFYIL